MTIVKAEKSRLAIRGVRNGRTYRVERERDGWWIQPVQETSQRAQSVKRAKADLGDHLQALAEAGFSFEPTTKETVPPCRF